MKKSLYTLHIKLIQYDYAYYSRRVHSSILLIDRPTGTIHFLDSIWQYNIVKHIIPEGEDIQVHLKLLEGHVSQTNITISFTHDDWSPENYVLMPAAAYNGNRFESRRIPYSPKLYDPRDIGPDKAPIISDVPRLNIHDGPSCIQDRSGAMSIPSMGFYSPAKQFGYLLFTPQASRLGDFGYSIEENRSRDKATFSISAPVVRERYQYRITDNQHPSQDKAPDWKEGDEISMPIHLHHFPCESIQGLFDHWNKHKHSLIPKPAPTLSMPFSATFPTQEKKFNTENWVEEHGYYSVGTREMFLQDWQIGWTGGMISTYPLLAHGTKKTKERVLRNFNFLFPNGIAPSSFFYDCGESKGDGFHFYGGDIRKAHTANWHLTRKSADGLYFIIKQFWLMEALGIEVQPAWKQGIKNLSDAFTKLWKENGQLGNYINSLTGSIEVGGSTSAGIAPGGLAYAALYFNEKTYMNTAEAIANYFYKDYIQNGLTMGGVGDAMQNPDSESCYGLLESFCVLFEQTGNKIWLLRAEEMVAQFASWVISYNYDFPPNTTLGELGIQTNGAVYANTQNKHGAPGICTHSGSALLRLYRATRKTAYLELLRNIARFIPQLFSHPKQAIAGMQEGWITERVSTTDWFEGLGELMYGSTWAETSLMLTYTEIPGLYLITDEEFLFVIDSVEASIVGDDANKITLRIKNPASVPLTLKILTEQSKHLKKALANHYILNTTHLPLAAGEEKEISLRRDC